MHGQNKRQLSPNPSDEVLTKTEVIQPIYIIAMMTDSSQTRVFGQADGQRLHAHWWLQSLILDVQTLLHFRMVKVWVEDWDAAHSFCPLCLSSVASCLSASNLRGLYVH